VDSAIHSYMIYDVEGEVNGYLTYDRRWKIDPYKVREIHEKMGR